MTIKERLEQDLRAALLGGDRLQVDTLRGLKSSIQYAEVANGSKEQGLSEPDTIQLFNKEAKKRQESADIYQKAHETKRAQRELDEKTIIEHYLPAQLSDSDISKLIEEAINKLGTLEPATMGKVITYVKDKSTGTADGATVARLVKERLGQ